MEPRPSDFIRVGNLRTWCTAPCARGDGPTVGPSVTFLFECSPRTRGWGPLGPLWPNMCVLRRMLPSNALITAMLNGEAGGTWTYGQLSDAARTAWGKHDHKSDGWLPLWRHMTDSAAVAGLLWD